jgi:Putative prokaryotic signal transducing protein
MSGVTLTVVGSQMEAEALCGMLRADGIACGYRVSEAATAIGMTTGGMSNIGPVEILVDEQHLTEAQKLLPPDE